MSWRVARSLDVLLDEVNAEAPNRSKISDGSIGDAAHASRSSDHNAWRPDPEHKVDGVVGARDFTHDPSGGLDCNALARSLADLLCKHPAMQSGAYVIWRSQIISADRLSEGWRAYSGSNPHDHHLHVSVATAAAGYDSTEPWLTEDTMNPAQEARLERVEQAVDRIEDQLGTILAVVRKKGSNAWERDLDLKKLVKEVLAQVDKP